MLSAFVELSLQVYLVSGSQDRQRQRGQRSDSTGRTVLQTVAQTPLGLAR